VALYWPNGGYYATREALGPDGDFYTAPLTHPVFGASIARQIEDMWRVMGSPRMFWAVEAGAGTGRLAADVTKQALAADSAFADALRYLAVDVTAAPPADGASRVAGSGLPVRGVRGVVLANELLDAMPVHRVTVDGGQLREIRVGLDGEEAFVEVLAEPSQGVAERLEALSVTLPEGYRTEVCLAAARWIAEVASILETGYLLLVDYGHEASAYYDASRGRGTLRTYYQHALGLDPYIHVGRKDISVHVEFSSLRRAALAAGLTVLGHTSQADFLRSLGFDFYRRDVEERVGLRAQERVANLRALDTLVAPDGMGAFRVLAFGKNVDATPLAGFAGWVSDAASPAPLVTPEHMPLAGPSEHPLPTWDELDELSR
jgi:SAM-dependent MidA family methyltransferase